MRLSMIFTLQIDCQTTYKKVFTITKTKRPFPYMEHICNHSQLQVYSTHLFRMSHWLCVFPCFSLDWPILISFCSKFFSLEKWQQFLKMTKVKILLIAQNRYDSIFFLHTVTVYLTNYVHLAKKISVTVNEVETFEPITKFDGKSNRRSKYDTKKIQKVIPLLLMLLISCY